MKPNNIKILTFVYNYIFSPIAIIVMFWIIFFEGNSFSLQKIIDHKFDLKLYLALFLAIAFLIFFRRGIKLPKDNNK